MHTFLNNSSTIVQNVYRPPLYEAAPPETLCDYERMMLQKKLDY